MFYQQKWTTKFLITMET